MYFANDGGPLLLAPVSPRPLWEGGEIPSNGRVVVAESRTVQDVATDYDRACDVAAGAAILPAGESWVVVVNGEVGAATWLRLNGDSFALVSVDAWNLPPTADGLRARYESLAAGSWTPLSGASRLGPGGIELFHAAGEPGVDTRFPFSDVQGAEPAVIGSAIVFPAAEGTYGIELLEHVVRRTAERPGEYAVLVRFTKSTG